MNQNVLDHTDRSLKNKPAQIRKESKADRIMKKMFGASDEETILKMHLQKQSIRTHRVGSRSNGPFLGRHFYFYV